VTDVVDVEVAGRRPYGRLVEGAFLRYGTLLGLVTLIATFGVLAPGVFLSGGNMRNVVEQLAILGIISFTQTIVMVVGDFDLSVGALASLSGVALASLLLGGMPVAMVVVAAIGIGVVAGLVNGMLVAYLRLSAFVATLATMTSFGGLALLLTGGSTLFGLPATFVTIGQGRLGPLPIPVVILLATGLATWFLLAYTTLGRRWYAVGGNAVAVRLSGVNVDLVRLAAFVASGIGASVAGLVLTARLASAHPTAGHPLMLTSVAAVFLGMTLSRNGQPTIPGTAVGVLILGILTNGLNILQVSSYVQQVLTGVIIILAVSLSGLAQRARR
jgi:ribose transport system permease protein